MNPTITNALWITLIGMSLVFIALLLLWGLMSLLVRVTERRAAVETAPAAEASEPAAAEEAAAAPADDRAIIRRKAAAAAVAVAIASQPKGNGHLTVGHRAVQPETQPFSAWQPVMRANRLNQRSKMYMRK